MIVRVSYRSLLSASRWLEWASRRRGSAMTAYVSYRPLLSIDAYLYMSRRLEWTHQRRENL